MNTNVFTPQMIIALKAKHGNTPLFKLDGEVRTAGETVKGKKDKKDITSFYIPFKCVTMTDTWAPLLFKMSEQVICSGIRLPYRITDPKKADYVTITYRKLNKEDLINSDYLENKHDRLLKSNQEFIDALNIIIDEYIDLVSREVFPEFKKGKKAEFSSLGSKKVHSIRQSTREVTEADENQNDETEDKNNDNKKDNNETNDGEKKKIKLENPLFRIKLKVDRSTRKLGYSFNGKFFPTVFDMKKTIKESEKKGKPVRVAANVISKNVAQDLNAENAKYFVTYLSLSGGIINFENVCISKQGISLLCHFKELFILRHKPKKIETINMTEMTEMTEYCAKDDVDDEEVNADSEEQEENNAKQKNNKQNKSRSRAMQDLEFENEEDEEDFGTTTQEPDENEENEEDEEDEEDENEESNNASIEEVKKVKLSTKKKVEEQNTDEPLIDNDMEYLQDDDPTNKSSTKSLPKKQAPKKTTTSLKAGDRKKQK